MKILGSRMPVNCWRTCYLAAASLLTVFRCGYLAKKPQRVIFTGEVTFTFGFKCARTNWTLRVCLQMGVRLLLMLLVRTLKCTAQLQVSWSASLVFQIKAHCTSILCDVSCQSVYLLYLFRSNFKKNQPNKTWCTQQLFGTMAWGQQVYSWVSSSLTCK